MASFLKDAFFYLASKPSKANEKHIRMVNGIKTRDKERKVENQRELIKFQM